MSAAVGTFEVTADVVLDNQLLTVPALYTVETPVQNGDSGGIVYSGSRAVGIVVARSCSGLCWFQPLETAVQYLESLSPSSTLQCFT